MGSSWKKLKGALGLGNLCVYVPRTLEDDASASSYDGGTRYSNGHSGSVASGRSSALVASRTGSVGHSGSVASGRSESRHSLALVASRAGSVGLSLSKNGSRSSKKTCIICLGTMKSGNGRALFTAECSHTFHFQCIVSNVKHGNNVCPICRAKWKEVPFQAPLSSDLPYGRPSRVNPVYWSPEDGQMTILRRLPRANSTGRQQSLATLFHIPEPASFNDDEAMDHQVEPARRIEQSSAQTVDIKTYTEFSAVQQSVSKENFTILIHLKAPVTNLRQNSGGNNSATAFRAPVDLVTVLDVSGSMVGTKLALLKRAMGFVIQNLGPSDRLSVVAFSSTARRLFHLRRMTESGRQQALQAVNSLVSSGGTNIAEGLKKGVKVIDERREKNPVCSIILLSDGQDTYTVSSGSGVGGHSRPDYDSLLPISIRGRTGHHTPVHAFGFGADHDSASMHSISEASGGTFSFIETEGVIQDAFAQCIGGLLSVVVQAVQVRVECVHFGVHICSIKTGSYASEVMEDRRKGSVDLGDLYADEERDFLVSVNVPSTTSRSEGEDTVLFKVGCVYRDSVSMETIHVNAKDVSIQRPEVVVAGAMSIEVDRQRNRLRAAEAMAEARTSAERGELSNAVSILENCRQLLAETPAARSGDRLCIALDAELKEMQERMASRRRYEASGRAYVLSGLSSHSWQRATARGDSTGSNSIVHSYQTPSMVDMLHRSQTIIPAAGHPNPLVHPTQSMQFRTR